MRAGAAAREQDPGKTVLACMFGSHPVTISPAGAADVPIFGFPDDAAYALGRVTRYAAWRAAPEGEEVVPDGAATAEAREQVAEIAIDGITDGLVPGKKLKVTAKGKGGTKEFEVIARLDTPNEVEYYKNGGILQYVLRRMLKTATPAKSAG